MEPGFILLIILFVVAPLLEKLMKAGKQQPPQQRPRTPQQRPRIESTQRPTTTARTERDDAAAGMVPEDLWEILTGEKRLPRPAEPQTEEEWEIDPEDPSTWTPPSRRVPAPSRAEQPAPPARVDTPARVEQRFPSRRAEPPDWTDPTWRPQPREARTSESFEDEVPEEIYVRPLPVESIPEIVSLEQLTIDDEARHEAFHERLIRGEQARAGLAASRRPASRRAAELRLFESGNDVRRAIIAAEVLGRPKGLE